MSTTLNTVWSGSFYTGYANISLAALGYTNPIITSYVLISTGDYSGIVIPFSYDQTTQSIRQPIIRPDSGKTVKLKVIISIKESSSV